MPNIYVKHNFNRNLLSQNTQTNTGRLHSCITLSQLMITHADNSRVVGFHWSLCLSVCLSQNPMQPRSPNLT